MKIRQVDATIEKHASLLRWLQLEILPLDEPANIHWGAWWIATDAMGHPVGFAGLQASTQWEDAAYLCRAGVLPAARGQGLQRRLIQVRERKARTLGCRWLISDTYENPASANNLIASGFKMFSPSTPWAADGACYWKKDLTT